MRSFSSALGVVAFLSTLVSLPCARVAAQDSSVVSVSVGLSAQSDAKLTRGVRPSPLGVAGGLEFHRAHRGIDVGVSGLVSWYPQLVGDRTIEVTGQGSRTDPNGSLTFSTLTIELGPDRAGRLSWFGCAGAVAALTTPRPGKKVVPVGCIGLRLRRFLHGQLDVRYQQFMTRLGETGFQIPIVVAIPLKH